MSFTFLTCNLLNSYLSHILEYFNSNVGRLSLSLNDIIVLSDGNPQHTETLYTDFCNYCCYHTLPFFNILTRHSSLQMRRKEDLHVHMVGACLVLILRFLMWRTLWLVMYDATGVRLQAGRQAEV